MAATILGDWGTTRLRLWLLAEGVVLDRREGPGIGALQQPPADTLGAIIAPWLDQGKVQRIGLCGMAGARAALHEVAYVDCPARVADWRQGAARTAFGAIPLRIAAGLACRVAMGVPDVMRGEETQLFGAIARDPRLGQGRHHVILPGTHSKWVALEDGRITGFRTFLTGELFGLLQRSSLLMAPGVDDPADDAAGFAEGLSRARNGIGILGSLFEARAAQLRDARSRGWARGFLSGLVIGCEVGEMLRAEPVSGVVTIIGDPQLAARYEAALSDHDLPVQRADGDGCVLAGLELLDADD